MSPDSPRISFSDKFPPWLNPANMAWFGLLVMALTLSWAEAIQNISVGIILAATLWYLWETPTQSWITDKDRWRHGLLMVGIFGLSVVAGLYTDNLEGWTKDLREKLPFLLLGLSLGILPRCNEWQLYLIFVGFLIIQAFIAVMSLAIFFQHYEMGMGRIARNASIPIAVKISHIYFSVLLAGSVLVGIWVWLKKMYLKHPYERYLVLFLTILNFVCLHMLSTRTGLVAMYTGLGLGVLVYVIRMRAWRAGILFFVLLVSVPVISYYAVPTFRTKIHASLWDIQGYGQSGRNLAHHSASLRLVAWEAAIHIFQRSPLYGVGIADLEAEMIAEYKRNEMRASLDQLPKNPHNQYIEFLAGFGIVGVLLLLMVCLYPWIANRKKISFLFISFVGMYMGALFAESLLERQIGMYFFIIFSMLLSSCPSFALYPTAIFDK